MINRRVLAAAVAFSLAAGAAGLAIGQGMPPLSTDPAAAPAGEYAVDPMHTSVIARASHMGLSHFAVRFDKVDGHFTYDPAHPTASKVTATVDATSLDVGTQVLPAGNGKPEMTLNDHFIKERDLAGGSKTALATFVSTAITSTGAGKGTMAGDLTLNGVTKPVTFDVTFNGTRNMGAQRMGFTRPDHDQALRLRSDALPAAGGGQRRGVAGHRGRVRPQGGLILAGDDVAAAVRALKDGRLVILPTETVYGLGCDAGDPRAVGGRVRGQGRPRFNPMIAHVAGLAAADAVAVLDARARRLAEAFWPGPLTLVAPVARARGGVRPARAGAGQPWPCGPPTIPWPRRCSRRSAGRWPRPLPTARAGPAPPPSPTRWKRPAPSPPRRSTAGPAGWAWSPPWWRRWRASCGCSAPGGDHPASRSRPSPGPWPGATATATAPPGRLARHYAPAAPVRLGVERPAPGHGLHRLRPRGGGGPPGLEPQPRGRPGRGGRPTCSPICAPPTARGPAGIDVAPIPDRAPGRGDQRPVAARGGLVG